MRLWRQQPVLTCGRFLPPDGLNSVLGFFRQQSKGAIFLSSYFHRQIRIRPLLIGWQ